LVDAKFHPGDGPPRLRNQWPNQGDWFEALLFAVAVAVDLTPEMLPMIVTVNLAKGAMAMSRKKVIVKRLNAIQNFGAMDVLVHG
jgi:P-type Mg2+ transporter